MRKSFVVVGAVALVVAGIAPASADTATLGTSFASAANITPGSGIAPTVGTTGDLSGLLDFLTPVLDEFVAPLTSEISNAPTTVASILAADLGQSISADSAGANQSAPNNGDLPDCATSGWDAGNCFAAASADISADPLVSIDLPGRAKLHDHQFGHGGEPVQRRAGGEVSRRRLAARVDQRRRVPAGIGTDRLAVGH
jgi:hypothetical protein